MKSANVLFLASGESNDHIKFFPQFLKKVIYSKGSQYQLEPIIALW
jgi:hypothetical protein